MELPNVEDRRLEVADRIAALRRVAVETRTSPARRSLDHRSRSGPRRTLGRWLVGAGLVVAGSAGSRRPSALRPRTAR